MMRRRLSPRRQQLEVPGEVERPGPAAVGQPSTRPPRAPAPAPSSPWAWKGRGRWWLRRNDASGGLHTPPGDGEGRAAMVASSAKGEISSSAAGIGGEGRDGEWRREARDRKSVV